MPIRSRARAKPGRRDPQPECRRRGAGLPALKGRSIEFWSATRSRLSLLPCLWGFTPVGTRGRDRCEIGRASCGPERHPPRPSRPDRAGGRDRGARGSSRGRGQRHRIRRRRRRVRLARDDARGGGVALEPKETRARRGTCAAAPSTHMARSSTRSWIAPTIRGSSRPATTA